MATNVPMDKPSSIVGVYLLDNDEENLGRKITKAICDGSLHSFTSNSFVSMVKDAVARCPPGEKITDCALFNQMMLHYGDRVLAQIVQYLTEEGFASASTPLGLVVRFALEKKTTLVDVIFTLMFIRMCRVLGTLGADDMGLKYPFPFVARSCVAIFVPTKLCTELLERFRIITLTHLLTNCEIACELIPTALPKITAWDPVGDTVGLSRHFIPDFNGQTSVVAVAHDAIVLPCQSDEKLGCGLKEQFDIIATRLEGEEMSSLQACRLITLYLFGTGGPHHARVTQLLMESRASDTLPPPDKICYDITEDDDSCSDAAESSADELDEDVVRMGQQAGTVCIVGIEACLVNAGVRLVPDTGAALARARLSNGTSATLDGQMIVA